VAAGPCRAGKLSALAFAKHEAHHDAMAATTSSTAPRENTRRLVYVRPADLDRWQCRPVGTIGILDLHDRQVGHLDGIVIDKRENQPTYLVIAGPRGAARQRQHWFLVPVGDAWFDDGTRAVRIDATKREQVPFDPDEFERMSPEQADEFERRLLASCCPEVGFHRDGTPDYARLQQFKCPTWLRE
jgi:hypothetical protein